ncbi:DUF1631 family protein [Hahella sp. HN01]|uniref:DUF1631 family protein n=1 Tax=Hahella sp. HN01 TaxID=2847262 RepID=UPI001C1ED4CD|nr:DUF1631 family protein [Hahella sp. HN01]MBU6951579.1 DUF1631 family protein [Hahella sp. HN01]
MSEISGREQERRASQRRPIQLSASLDFKGLSGLSCTIADFCPEGVYVTYPTETAQRLKHSGFTAGQRVQVSFIDPFVNRNHELKVNVVRAIDGAMGGSFAEGNMAAVTALLRICGAENIGPGAPKSSTDSASLLMRQCERVIHQHLTPLFDTYLRALPKSFDEAINTAPTDNQRSQLADAAIALAKQNEIFSSQFFKHVGQALTPRAESSAKKEEERTDLSLIDKSEFEDWLTLKVMVTKAETTYRAVLVQLKMRLDAAGVVCNKGYNNAVGPPLLCYALRDTLIQLHLPLPAERLCLRVFERTVLAELGPVYAELNDLLVRRGVLPNLDLSKYLSTPEGEKKAAEEESAKKPPAESKQDSFSAEDKERAEQLRQKLMGSNQEESKQPAKPVTAPDSNSNPPPSGAQGERDMHGYLADAETSFAAVNKLFEILESNRALLKQKEQQAPPFPKASEAPQFRNEEILFNLQSVQQAPPGDGVSLEESGLRERLFSVLQNNEAGLKSFGAEQDKALDVVDRFFASLLKNQKLSGIAKMQIKGLELPVLRLLMRNPDFLEQNENTAHKVINRIAQIGVKGGRSSQTALERINTLIHRIQVDHERDPGVFDEALAELDELLERQNLLYRRNVERVTAAAEGQQKVEEAKQAVIDEIEQRIAGKKVPRAVATLLNGGWRDLLSLTYIRQGASSQAWYDYLSVLDTLIHVGDDPSFEFNLPELLRIIQDGLSAISSNHMPSGHIRDELKRLLVRSVETAPEMVTMPDNRDESSDPGVQLLGEARQRGLQRWLMRAQKLKVGDWLRLERDEKEAEFIRLVWVGRSFSRYVFVNHQGMKVIDLDALTLAAYLQKGIAAPDESVDTPVVDQGLDAMVQDLYEQLSHASSHDELTGLIQRKEFERQALVKLSQSSDGDKFVGLLVSLGQFRLINESAGIEAGDQALKDIAGLLKALFTPKTLVCRFGGDEFMLLVEGEATAAVEKITTALRQYQLQWESNVFSVSASIGYVEVSGGVLDVPHMMQAVEEAARRAKSKGGNRVEEFDVDQALIARRDAIASKVASLGKELENERVLLRCQKIIPLHPAAKMGAQYEILLSIYDDNGNLIPAGDFVRAAETYKRMQAVDRWVVGHMLDWMSKNRQQIETMGGVSINLSGHSLNDEGLLEFIFERLTKYDCPMDKMCFEITEAAAISNLCDVSEFIVELQEYGCRFCLGDFGTAMASYQYLKQLPVDLIKVDGSFVKDVATDQNDQTMIRSMTEMAHYLGREIIAPQVETKESLEMLQKLGVDYVQGFYIERPKSLANF